MMPSEFTRREVLQTSSAAVAMLFTEIARPGFLFAGEEATEELVPFLDMPPAKPNMLDWETLDSWITPQDQVFSVSHYGEPDVDAKAYQLEVTGLVDKPRSYTLEDLKALPAEDRLMTLECSGNGSAKGFIGAVYNSKWTGVPLATILKAAGIKASAKEIVFFGVDKQSETLRKGTPRELTVDVPFGRSMSVEDASNPNIIVAYARNDQPLEKRNGAPVRLIVPGWYGIANVKWLHRIEVRDRRYMGRFMGRDYVTVRGEKQGNEVVFIESSVTRMNLKSIVARITRKPATGGMVPLKAYGAVWSDGTDIVRVEVKIDDGPWREATLDKEPHSKYCWRFFSIDLGNRAAGKHTVVSRAVDTNGRFQPAATDDEIALKKTYWEAYAQWPREIEVKA